MAKLVQFLPDGEGFYEKRGVVYTSFRIAGEKFAFSTGIKRGEPGFLTGIRQFKMAKIAEATAAQKDPTVTRGVRDSELFTDYVAYLKRKEAEKGDYTTGERTTSQRTEGFIKNH